MKNLSAGKGSAFGQHVTKASKGVQKIISATGAAHSFSEEEKVSFVEHINSALQNNVLCQGKLPINENNNDLFSAVGDGLILWYVFSSSYLLLVCTKVSYIQCVQLVLILFFRSALINHAVADTIDTRVVNTKANMSSYMKIENLNLAINSAKGIGCSVVNIGAQDIMNGTEHIILGLIWQIVRVRLSKIFFIDSLPLDWTSFRYLFGQPPRIVQIVGAW